MSYCVSGRPYKITTHKLTDEFKAFILGLTRSSQQKGFKPWAAKHFECPHRESPSRTVSGQYGTDCKGFACRGNYRHNGADICNLLERAMNAAEAEKIEHAAIFDPPSKLAAKQETTIKFLESRGRDAEQEKEELALIKKFVAASPGRKQGRRAAPRRDGIATRLAQRSAKILTAAGIPCHGDAEPEGMKLIFSIVTDVCGKIDPEKIKDAIRKK